MNAVLDDILVLDFSTLLPGPMASLFLAEAGAEVVKLERPGRGEEMRSFAPRWGADSAGFNLLNRGKKSIAIDLKDPAATQGLRPLLEKADVVLEQFRPGVMERLGFGYEDLCKINPDIIYCSITGYGQTGPKSLRAGHDLNYIAETGLLALSHGTPDAPVVPPALIADIAGGAYPAILNILLALRQRDRTGKGARLDISMADNLFPFMFWALGAGQLTGVWPGNQEGTLAGGSCRYRLYRTADRGLVAAAPLEEKFWRAFVQAIGLEERLRDDGKDPGATLARIAEIIGSKSAAHWRSVFEAADCCCSVVQTLAEALEDPHFKARGLFDGVIVNETGAEMIALPCSVDPALRIAAAPRQAPRLGEHNAMLKGAAVKSDV
jgi:crotonobetainyl-CoA:carnitine CoA-transferase CaiB-like acyl-CoA transferase